MYYIFGGGLLCYCICWFPFVSPFGLFSIFGPISSLYAEVTHFFPPCVISCAQWADGVGGGAVAWVAWSCSWLCAKIYASARFNVPTRCSIPGPSPAPCPAGECGVKFRVSYVSMISQPRFWFDRFFTPICVKWVHIFSLPWFDSVARLRPGLTSLECHW